MLAYWDKDLICRYANAAYIDWFGRTKEEMVDKITLKELLGPLFEKNSPYIFAALEGKPQIFEREIPTPKGGLRYSLANYVPDISGGLVKGFFVHVADITPLKLLEKELLQSNEIIKEQNNRLLNFANVVSHNLKNHAAGLEGFLDLLIETDSDEKKKEILKYLKAISSNFNTTIKHLNEIVYMQNMSKLKPELVNLHDYIENSIETLRLQIESSKAIIRNNVSADLKLLSNPAYMESIILNFLTNAIKYRHPSRVPVISLDSYVGENEIVLEIKDNGLGIDLDKYGNELFQMYKTFHGNPDAQGIGLFIAKYQVESMGGRIKVESEVDKGTAFSIYFQRLE